jgi:hypothetical protein
MDVAVMTFISLAGIPVANEQQVHSCTPYGLHQL